MCVPTVMAFSDEATKERFVGPALRGEEIWCQLFSEPSGGSDVAASRTRAVRAEDGSGDWIIDGQKVWTSGAHYSAFGLVLVRTNPDVPKHQGLTMFWIDMHSPGVEIRPIHQATGESDFNEVYFTGLRIPGQPACSARWTRLEGGARHPDERAAGGGRRQPAGTGGTCWSSGAACRERTARARRSRTAASARSWRTGTSRRKGCSFTRLRSLTALSRGQTPGPEASIGKIVSARQMQEVASEALERLDQLGLVVAEDARFTGLEHTWFWGAALQDRRRHRRNPEEHHRGTRAGAAVGYPRRSRRGVQGPASRRMMP